MILLERTVLAILVALVWAPGALAQGEPDAAEADAGPVSQDTTELGDPTEPDATEPTADTAEPGDAAEPTADTTELGDATEATADTAELGDATEPGDGDPGDAAQSSDAAVVDAAVSDEPSFTDAPPTPTLCFDTDPPIALPDPPEPLPAQLIPPPPERAPISPSDAIKAILGVLILLTLAYLGGHPRVARLEQRLRISQVITAGFPFVLFGLAAHSDGLGILTDAVLEEIRPLLPLGLGWIGFTFGFRFDLRRVENLPTGVGSALVLTTILPFLAVVGVTSLLFGLLEGVDDSSFLRDAILLATAGAMTARTVPGLISTRGAEANVVDRVSRVIKLEEVIAFVALIMVAAFFRPDETLVGWRVPSVGWVFITIGVGTILGGLVFALMRTVHGTAEAPVAPKHAGKSEGAGGTMIAMLGSICFAAGLASYLRLSPLVVCFLAGALVSNLPGAWKEQVGTALSRLERPIYLVFLVLAGAYWRVGEWQGWVLMVLFVATRLFARFIGVRLFTGQHPDALSPVEQRNLAASPMGALSIAIIINAQDLYSGQTLPWIVTAIIGGSLLTEIVVQLFALGRDVATLTPLAPLRPRTVSAMPAVNGPPAAAVEGAPPPDESPLAGAAGEASAQASPEPLGEASVAGSAAQASPEPPTPEEDPR